MTRSASPVPGLLTDSVNVFSSPNVISAGPASDKSSCGCLTTIAARVAAGLQVHSTPKSKASASRVTNCSFSVSRGAACHARQVPDQPAGPLGVALQRRLAAGRLRPLHGDPTGHGKANLHLFGHRIALVADVDDIRRRLANRHALRSDKIDFEGGAFAAYRNVLDRAGRRRIAEGRRTCRRGRCRGKGRHAAAWQVVAAQGVAG